MISRWGRRKTRLTERGLPQLAAELGLALGDLMRLRRRLEIPAAQDITLSLEHRVRVLLEGGVLVVPHRERKLRLRGSLYQVTWGGPWRGVWHSANASEISWLACPEELVVLDLEPPKDNEVKE